MMNLTPEQIEALKKASETMFNPSPEAAAWMEKNRPSEEAIMAELAAYYLEMFPTDGSIH